MHPPEVHTQVYWMKFSVMADRTLSNKLPIPRLPTRAKQKTKEKKKTKIERDRARNKTRINIGPAFERWRNLRDLKGFKLDAELATFLLDSFQADSLVTSTPLKRLRYPGPAISTIAGESFSDRENDFVEEAQCFSGDGETTETITVLEASMSSLDIQDDIDEDVFNDIRNSVIDWAVYEDPENISPSEEEETIEDSFSDDSDDEDYMPPLCIRNSGVVTTGIHLEDLEAIGMDETVHDCPDNEPPEPTTLFEKVQVVEEGDIVGEPAAITYLICLKRLAEYLLLPIPLCTAKDPLTSVECRAPGPFRIDCKVRGTAVILQWVCPNEHCVWQWNSQPTFKFGMQAGDFMLATNILLSGNNFAKISLLFQFMNMKIVDRATFFRVQDAYCVDTIREFWHDCRSTIISGLKSKDSVVALADGRMDSPGFCAQFCTYTVMENDTKQIISVVNIDKRETKRISVNMEKEGFIRSFDKLRQEVKLTEICTDAHIQISALFNPSRGKYKDSGVHHTLDMWHGSKSLGKKIQSVGLKKGCNILLHWKRDICNHFWYCCKVNDNYDDFFSMWIGVLHHVTGEHVWALDACQHGPLADEREKEWIPKGSVAHDALSDIVLNGRWLKQVHKYLRFRSTSELESFHNHLLMYASKRNSFTFPVYEARIFLVALDYNSHCSRQPRRRPDGSIQYKKQFNKKSRKWSLYAVKEKKDYSYIEDIQRAIVKKRVSSGHGMPRLSSKRPDDPRKYGLLPDVPAPTTEELLNTQVSRVHGHALPQK